MSNTRILRGRGLVLGAFAAVGFPGFCCAIHGDADLVGFDMQAPPARILVTDERGRRIGVHPDFSLSANGTGKSINEFERAEVEQMNITSDDPNSTDASVGRSTGWYVKILDQLHHDYTVQLTGIADEWTLLRTSVILYPDPSPMVIPFTDTPVLMSPGMVRTFRIGFDHSTRVISIQRQVAPGDLMQSVKAACRMEMISSTGICESLMVKLNAAEAARVRGNMAAVRGALRAFIHEVTAQTAKAIDADAAAVLHEEAEAWGESLSLPASVVKPAAPKSKKVGPKIGRRS